MDSIDKAIEDLKEHGCGDEDMRQLNDLEYHGSVGDDEPVMEGDDFLADDPDDDRLPSERFYNPRGR